MKPHGSAKQNARECSEAGGAEAGRHLVAQDASSPLKEPTSGSKGEGGRVFLSRCSLVVALIHARRMVFNTAHLPVWSYIAAACHIG